VTQVVGPEFKPQYRKNRKKKKEKTDRAKVKMLKWGSLPAAGSKTLKFLTNGEYY
jgi:hypothetical protein